MAVRTWVGRFCVSDGHVEEEGAWLGSLIRQRPDDESDELYVLVEPAAPGSEQYAAQLVDVIAQLYHKDALSVTGALTRSLRAAHDHLRDWNRKSLKEHRVAAGTSCLAIRGDDAYLAQAGPGIAYVLSANGEFRRLDSPQGGFEHALGIPEHFAVHPRRVKLEPGTLILLASSQLDAVAPAEHVERILRAGADDAPRELYLLCRDLQNFALVLLSAFEHTTVDALPPFLSKDGGTAEPSPADEQVERVADLTEVGTAAAPRLQPARASLSEGGAIPAARGGAAEHVRALTRETAPAPAAGVRLRGREAAPRYRRTGSQLSLNRIPKLAVAGAAALVLVGLIAWWQLPDSVEEGRQERYEALIASARLANAQAQATDDATLKRELLDSAQANLSDAAKTRDDSGELRALTADVTAARAVLDAVFEIDGFSQVMDLANVVTGELAITQVVAGADHAYFLDAKGGRILSLVLTGGEAPETILQAGEPAGFATPGTPSLIAWSQESGQLLIVDDARQVFAYTPGAGATPLVLRGADSLGSMDAVTTSGGNLYVLDVGGAQVWRYLPGQGGFDSERTGLLDTADLKDASEIAVGQDVYVLDTSRGIRRFSGKTESEFALAGIDRPLLSPASLSVLPGSSRLVVADRGNKRIVIASAEGEFIRQIVSPSFTDLRAAAVDEGRGILYVLNGDALLQAPFPP